MTKKIRPGLLILAISLPLCVGGLSAWLTDGMRVSYFFLNKPAISPPSWIFPVVWTILYGMMGLASYYVLTSGADRGLITKAMAFYGIQLVLNFFWSLLFFNKGLFLWALVDLLAMWVLIIIATVLFFRASKIAGAMMIPLIAWVTFAAYLNYAVYKLSITPMPMPR